MANLLDFSNLLLLILMTVISGISGLLLYLISRRNGKIIEIKKPIKRKSYKNEKLNEIKEKSTKIPIQKSRKKIDKRWINHPSPKGFSSPWLIITLKGHVVENFSNCVKEKYSSGEEHTEFLSKETRKKPEQNQNNNKNRKPNCSSNNKNSSKENNKTNSSPKGLKSKEKQKLVHRSQKGHQLLHHLPKQRNLNNFIDQETTIHSQEKTEQIGTKTKEKTTELQAIIRLSDNIQSKPQLSVPLQIPDTKMSYENHFIQFLKDFYLLTPEEIEKWGFPTQSKLHENCGEFYYHDIYNQTQKTTKFDVNAREFIPKSCSSGSSSGVSTPRSSISRSSSSSDCYSDLFSEECASYLNNTNSNSASIECKCVRCGKGFFIYNNKYYLTNEHCHYHWGKTIGPFYTCCNKLRDSVGCTVFRQHVWNGLKKGFNGPIPGYVQTQLKNMSDDLRLQHSANFGLYALDCEMCFTVKGMEVTKISVVDMWGRRIYDSYIRPESPIVDYNTRFSGITEKILSENPTKSFRQVQMDLLALFNFHTILIGHGLENDLRALKLIHYNIVDTSASFPHRNGWPYKQSLRTLVKYNLGKNIQDNSNGHDSYQDAWSCMELMLLKAKKEWPFFAQLNT